MRNPHFLRDPLDLLSQRGGGEEFRMAKVNEFSFGRKDLLGRLWNRFCDIKRNANYSMLVAMKQAARLDLESPHLNSLAEIYHVCVRM